MKYSIVSKHRNQIFGVAALLIFYFHLQPLFFQGVPVLQVLERFTGTQALMGVDIFVLLSSFGLAHSFEKGNFSWKRYLPKRILRVYPQLLIMQIILVLVMHQDVWHLLAGVLLIAQPIYGFFVQLWFLPFILVLYLIAPLYYFGIFRKFRNQAAGTAGMALLTVAVILVIRPWVQADWYTCLTRIPIFWLGFLWGYRSVHDQVRSRRTAWISFAVMVAALLLNYLLGRGYISELIPSQGCLVSQLIAPSLTALLALAFDRISRSNRGISRAFLGFLGFYGRISLEFYCVQELWHDAVRDLALFAPVRAVMPVTVACLILSTVSALVLHWVCNRLTRPLLNRL